MSRRLLLSLAMVAALISVPLGAHQSAPKPISVAYNMFTLANGLTVILHEDHSVPVASVNVWYKVGSANEKPGRTGFAHLFEHLMFEGSGHVKEGDFDNFLEAAGGSNNASTSNDVTDYYIDVPSNAIDLALFLESDRLGYLLDVVTPAMVDGQRDIVKNERRQSYENAPYGMAEVRIPEIIYPKNHPYHWPVVGYMEDLTAASAEDVKEFFRKFYTPSNAVVAIAGDFNSAELRKRMEYWFADVKPGPAAAPIEVPPVEITSVIKESMTDQVQLPRLYLTWITPRAFAPGDAELDVTASLLAGGKTSRLYKRLVYDLQVAQNVSAAQETGQLGSQFRITVTPKPSQDPPQVALDKMKAIIDEELQKLRDTAPTDREMQRVMNGLESSFYSQMERVNGQARSLNSYFAQTGNPDYFNEDLARYRALAPNDIQAAVRRWLPSDKRLEFSVLPAEKK
ncbi:MAG: pitrilysin family protein [Acidobacteriota bacterium]